MMPEDHQQKQAAAQFHLVRNTRSLLAAKEKKKMMGVGRVET
jgi:hypothetical protein